MSATPPKAEDDQGADGSAGEGLRGRGRRLLLTEAAFAQVQGSTLSGLFLTALIVSLGGGAEELGWALAASQIGAVGMLLANPIINRVGSRRRFCLAALGGVRTLRLVIAALPLLIYLGVARRHLLWPILACLLASALFGHPAEIARRSWISDLVDPTRRGSFIAKRLMIGSGAQMLVMLVGGYWLDFFKRPGRELLVGISIFVAFGGAMGWTGWTLLLRAHEPPIALPRRPTGLMRSLVLPWRHPRFRPLIVTGAMNALAVNVCAGFFDLYMLKHVGMKYSWVAAVNIVGELVALAAAPVWGAWADRAGGRRVLSVSIFFKGLFPAVWVFIWPSCWYIAFPVAVLRMFNSAGQMAQFRLSLSMSPARNQTAFLAMQQTFMSAGGAVGSLIGGRLAAVLGTMALPVIAGVQVVPLHVLFLLSALLRLMCMGLLPLLREPRRTIAGAGRLSQAGAGERPAGDAP